MRVAAVRRAFPDHYATQDELIAAFRAIWAKRHHNLDRIEQLHRHVLVGGRHLALAPAAYADIDTFGKANDAYLRVATDVGAKAVGRALEACGAQPKEVDAIFFTSITGIGAPSVDALLCNRLGFRSDIKRVPMFGLGCVGGAAGLARAADYVRAFPRQMAILVAVELCSLTLQRDDLSIPNLIASGLFGDGGSCVVVVGAEHPLATGRGPRIVDTRSAFYPDTQDVMGWSISERGFQIVLSAGVPEMVRLHLRSDTEQFLQSHSLQLGDVGTWIAHTGGPKVLEAMEQTLSLPPDALAKTWASLREVGNVSSASVLFVLEEAMQAPPPPGGHGVLLAMGPGFCSELLLLRWDRADD